MTRDTEKKTWFSKFLKQNRVSVTIVSQDLYLLISNTNLPSQCSIPFGKTKSIFNISFNIPENPVSTTGLWQYNDDRMTTILSYYRKCSKFSYSRLIMSVWTPYCQSVTTWFGWEISSLVQYIWRCLPTIWIFSCKGRKSE